MVWYDYQWMVGVGATLSFFTAYGIGANDLANAFASSVGSRALTIPQACLIAAIFEFAGAVGLGSIVTDTIRSGIVNYKYFTKQPEIYMLGMLCVIGATGLWLLLATLLEMPVSTTHSCVGGVIGFGICAGGVNSVVWYKVGKAGEFPVGGVSGIFISWVFSPVASGILAAAFFWIARTTTLRQKNSFAISFWTYPAWIFVALWLNLLFILLKGATTYTKNLSVTLVVLISMGASGGFALLLIPVMKYYLRPKVERDVEKRIALGEVYEDPENPDRMLFDYKKIAANEAAAKKKRHEERAAQDEANGGVSKIKSLFRTVTQGLQEDVHDVVGEDDHVGEVHDSAENFDARTEESFKYLQVFTAMCDSFSHGANDVANAVGPLAGMYQVYRFSELTSNTDADMVNDMYWILAIGGGGIVLGLSTLGYVMMRAIGVKLTKITPSRGFAIELGSALIIVIGSKLGLPLSTTHCQVGATIGVGLLEDAKGVNWSIVPKIVIGWVITLVVVGFSVALFFALGAYTPSSYGVRDVNEYRKKINDFIEKLSAYITKSSNGVFTGSGANITFQTNVWTGLEEQADDYADTQVIAAGLQTELLNQALKYLIGTGIDKKTSGGVTALLSQRGYTG